MQIRPAEPGDASRIAEILVFGNRVHFYPIFQDDGYSFGEMQVLPIARQYEEDGQLRARTYVYDDGIVRGVIQVCGEEVQKLYVDAFFVGRGIGAAMIEYAKAHLQVTWLWALEKNERAIRFYEQHGFELTGERMFEEGTTEYLVKMKRKQNRPDSFCENVNEDIISLELLTPENIDGVRAIDRADISEEFVDGADTIMELTQYGIEHGCIGHTYAIRYDGAYIGVILLGEAIEWETDPEEMRSRPFYRLMGFVLDRRYRGKGIGGYVLEEVIRSCYREYGERPIALGCHRNNRDAARFYMRHGFRKTDAMEGNDVYYLRYPEEAENKCRSVQ